MTGLDLASRLIETARRRAAELGLAVQFDVGDVERLPYGDAPFDVVSSAHGVVFAVDHRAVAAELARVCRPGGRLGLTYWLPNPELQRLMERVGYRRPDGAGRPADWARRNYVARLLGDDFELDFAERVCPWTGESGEALWQLFLRADGPAKAGVAALPDDERDALHRDWVDYFERHRTDAGISAPAALSDHHRPARRPTTAGGRAGLASPRPQQTRRREQAPQEAETAQQIR